VHDPLAGVPLRELVHVGGRNVSALALAAGARGVDRREGARASSRLEGQKSGGDSWAFPDERRAPHALVNAVVARCEEILSLERPARSIPIVAFEEFPRGIDHKIRHLDQRMPD
jgi:hypothetical protein